MVEGVNSFDKIASITYLAAPYPLSIGCCPNFESVISFYLPVGNQSASIKVGGQAVVFGDILKIEYGMVVLIGNNNSSLSFFLCNIEIITK